MANKEVTADPTTDELKSPNPLYLGNGGQIIGQAGSTVDFRNSTVFLPSAPTTVSNVISVATMAALRGTVVAGLPDGSYVIIAGFYAKGDGGGGTFVYSTSSSATDNGGTIIAPNVGSGRFIRVYEGAINIRWFGAKGDGVTNDTSAIQAADRKSVV